MNKLIQLIALFSAAPLQAGTLTLVTHGMNTGVDDWVLPMCRNIRDYQAARGEECDVYKVKLPLQTMVQQDTTFEVTRETFTSTNADRNVVIAFDWSAYASSSWVIFVEHDTPQVAQYLAPFLKANGPLLSRPMHLIGHSRGGSLIAGAGDLLADEGYTIDHFTTLDPIGHPLSNDTAPHVPANVMFADNYFQHNEEFANGASLVGAVNRQPFLADQVGPSVSDGHWNIHVWYDRTVNPDRFVAGNGILLTQWFLPEDEQGRKTGYFLQYCEHGFRSELGFQTRRLGRPDIEWSYNSKTAQLRQSVSGDATGAYFWQLSHDFKTWKTTSTNWVILDGRPFETTESVDLTKFAPGFYRLESFTNSF